MTKTQVKNRFKTRRLQLSSAIAFIWLLFAGTIQSQDAAANTLTYNDFIAIVKDNHPLTYRANLLVSMAEANTLRASGNFDPKIYSDLSQKNFDDKNYYRLFSSSLKVPTWFGVDFKAGYDQTRGDFLDPMEVLPDRGIWVAGFTANLGNGLFFDERRAEVRKAEVFERSSQVERTLLLNDLLFEANWAYLDWQAKYETLQVARLGLQIAEDRLEATKSSFINGDLPAIDTLETLIAVQSRTIDTLLAAQEFEAARLYLQNFLWQDGYIPLEIVQGTVPENQNIILFEQDLDSLQLFKEETLANHPEIMLYEFKLENLNIQDRLNRETLKPDLEIMFNPLIGTTADQWFAPYDVNDLKFGARFAYPLLLRKERGKLKMTRIKIQDTNFDMELKRQSISMKLDAYLSNSNLLVDQSRQLEATVENYLILLNAENQKFQIGESSIFLINSREVKYLESQIKLIETRLKVFKNRLEYLLTTGQLVNVI